MGMGESVTDTDTSLVADMMIFIVLVAVLATADAARNRLCYGDVMKLHPKGLTHVCSGSCAITKSQQNVQAHLHSLNQHKDCYQQAADANCIQASVIAALASRESGGGSLLDSRGYGDHGNAWGILQCDTRYSGLDCKSCGAFSCCHINMMVRDKVVPNIKAVARKHPSWTKEQQLQGAIAAYNFGVSNVQTWGGLDVGTANHQNHYSNDVMAQAQYLHRHGWN